jgi:hypothetical protein
MRLSPAIRHLLALVVVVGLLASGSSVLAAEAADPPSGVIAVTATGVTRAVGVQTFPRKATLPVVDLSLSPSGRGYATLDAGGTITSYGDAARFGKQSFPRALAVPAAIVLTPTGRGAYVGFVDGTLRALGDAPPVGGPAGGSSQLVPPLVDIALSPTGGVWALRANGTVDALGGAADLPNAPSSSSPAVGIAATPTGLGAWVARLNGSVVALGDAQGERGARESTEPRVADITSLGAAGWVVVDLVGHVEVAGDSPVALPGSGTGFVAIDSLAATSTITGAGDGAPVSTKVIAPQAILDTSGDPTETLVVTLPCYVTGGSTPLLVGDVLAASIGAETPAGLLRRVLAIGACANGAVEVKTEIATLSDALPEGEFDFSDDLSDVEFPDFEPTTQDGFIEQEPTPIVASPSRSSITPSSATAAGALGTIAEAGRFTYGCPSDPDDSDPKLQAKPSFTLNPEVVFEADWDDDSASARIGLGLQGDIAVDLSATGAIACDATFSFFDNRSLGTKVFFVGPLPVVVEPKFSLKAKLAGEAEIALTATASASGNLSAVAVIPGPGGSVGYDTSAQFTGTATASLEGKLGASFTLEPSMGFLLYGIVAPKAAVESGLSATLDPCSNPDTKIEQPAKLTFELEPADWLEDLLEEVENIDLSVEQEFELPGSPYLLYSTDLVPTPSFCQTPPTELPQGTVGQSYSTQISIEPPAGATVQSYAVASGSTLPPGLALSSEGALTGTPTQSGIYTFTVTATHTLGSVDGRFELIVVDDSLRITTDSLPSAELDEPYSVVLEANRPADELVWTLADGSGPLPEGITLDPDGTLSGTPTEAGFFSFTVRVQHTPASGGGGTVTKPLSLSVNGGSQIVFASNRDGNSEIYVMNADGSGQTRLTNHPSEDYSPAFSRYGRTIAFNSNRDGNAEIYVMNADGSSLTRLTNHPSTDIFPTVSPDGTKIAFQSNRHGENWQIYVMNADGSGVTRLTNHPSFDYSPAFSPDGTKIAFTSDRDGNPEIYLMNADGSGQTRLTHDPLQDRDPSFGG